MVNNKAIAQPGKRFDPLTTSRFSLSIEIDNVQEAGFSEVSGLEAEVDIFEYQEGGVNGFTHKLAGPAKFPNVTLKRGITHSNGLWEWFSKVAQGKIERKNLSVVLHNQAGDQVRRWDLTQAYPVKWVGPGLKADENATSIETLELAHKGMTLTNLAKGGA
jgi:phage tail-like protein